MEHTHRHTHSLLSQTHRANTHTETRLKKKKKKLCLYVYRGDDVRTENPASSATGDADREGKTTSGAAVPLLLFILQEVGRPVSRHPPPIYRLQGGVPAGVVHAAQRSVPAGRRRRYRPEDVRTSAVTSWMNSGEKNGGNRKNVFLPLIVENTVGHVQRPQERPDVVIRPVLQSVAEGEIK